MEESREREEMLEQITELAKSYPGDLLVQDVTPAENEGHSNGAIGLIAVAVTALVGGTVYGIRKVQKMKAQKREELKEELRKEIMKELEGTGNDLEDLPSEESTDEE